MGRMIQYSNIIKRWMGCSNACKRRRSQNLGSVLNRQNDMTLGCKSSDIAATQPDWKLIFPRQPDVSRKVVMRPGRSGVKVWIEYWVFPFSEISVCLLT